MRVERKVRYSGTSYIITIPPSWINDMDLERGDMVRLDYVSSKSEKVILVRKK